MSALQNIEHLENLFSLELVVEYIRIEKETQVSDELALGVRLLDFPTLLIYQSQRRSGHINLREQTENDKPGEYPFYRGKSCFFKMHPKSLHSRLSSTPLYAMVLDVKETIPKLVGSSMISLANVVDRICQDVAEHGHSIPSSHGERGLVHVSNLTGEKIGSISLSYKLLNLGAGLHQHISNSGDHTSIKVHRGQENYITKTNICKESLTHGYFPTLDKSDVNVKIQPNSISNANVMISENEQDVNAVCVDPEHIPESQIPETPDEGENNLEEDLTLFCPPCLYYTSSAEEKSKSEEEHFKLPILDPGAFTFEDSEEETAQNELEGLSSPVMHHHHQQQQHVRQKAPMSSTQTTSGHSPNGLGDALRKLPLLNALLVELSQLNGQTPHQPLSVHPNLAWIYRPASTEPLAEHGNTTIKAQAKSLQKVEHLKKLSSPRNCLTPILSPASVKKKNKQEESKLNKSLKKKLVYGTNKTFNLRLKLISPALKRHECMDLRRNETQSSVARGKTKSTKEITRPSKRKSVLNQGSSFLEPMIQNVTVDSALQETITVKHKSLHGKLRGRQDRDSQTISEQRSLSERGLKCIHIPTVNSDSVARNKDKNEHHSESNQSQSESDRHGEKIESSASSRHSSPKSSFSESGGEGNEDYADDFNSLETSDAFSPDPVKSPEPIRTKTPLCYFSNVDSGSESVQKRAEFPVRIKTPSSPQRALRGTHVIRPKTQASALGFFSDEDKANESDSFQSLCSRKKMSKSSRLERTSDTGPISMRSSGSVQECSSDSVSSFGLQEAEELADELGSLDFRKEYKHISELVTNKLPSYTM